MRQGTKREEKETREDGKKKNTESGGKKGKRGGKDKRVKEI